MAPHTGSTNSTQHGSHPQNPTPDHTHPNPIQPPRLIQRTPPVAITHDPPRHTKRDFTQQTSQDAWPSYRVMALRKARHRDRVAVLLRVPIVSTTSRASREVRLAAP